MVNDAERVVQKKYEAQGWEAIRGGEPDWLFIKRSEDGDIVALTFVEVKRTHRPEDVLGQGPSTRLSINQKIYCKALKSLGAQYSIDRPTDVEVFAERDRRVEEEEAAFCADMARASRNVSKPHVL